jgi:hypothetical protein
MYNYISSPEKVASFYFTHKIVLMTNSSSQLKRHYWMLTRFISMTWSKLYNAAHNYTIYVDGRNMVTWQTSVKIIPISTNMYSDTKITSSTDNASDRSKPWWEQFPAASSTNNIWDTLEGSDTTSEYSESEISSTVDVDGFFPCLRPFCKFETNIAEKLSLHTKYVHLVGNLAQTWLKWICSHCGTGYTCESDLYRHRQPCVQREGKMYRQLYRQQKTCNFLAVLVSMLYNNT